MLVKHLSERPTPLELRRPDIPHDLAATVMCLLEKDPADRFPDANALVAALDGAGPIPAPRASSPRATPVWSPLPAADAGVPAEDWMRWNAPVVDAFRRRLPRFIIVNAVIIVLAIITGTNLTFITAFWSVFLAFKYAKLWSEGYDWRDVFRQPRDRLFFDVLSETLDDFRALFDREKRAEVRARWRASRGKPGLMTPPVPGALARPSGLTAAELSVIGGTRAEVVRRAAMDRDEVAQLVASMPDREKKQLKDVTETARALAERVRAIAIALADLDRTTVSGGAGSLDREIARLEAQANPLDRDASEARVRRLATLKRDRRGAAERQRRRDELQAKQESCTLALQNLRFDVLRLKTGASSTANVTLLAERAMTLSRDVEDLIGPGASAPPERR
jgi:serine/threonine-protein kinase